jgi:DNA-binding FrmR family transcriptional regulator
MQQVSLSAKKDLQNRLSRIEGQAKGVQNMLDEGRSCHDVLHQLLAIRSAAHQASLALVRNHALECLSHPDQSVSSQEAVEALVGILAKVPY